MLERLGGAPIDSLVRAWRPYYGASTEAARLRDMAFPLTRGPPGPVDVRIRRQGRVIDLTSQRVPREILDLRRARTHDLPGEAFQRLTEEVAYLKLSAARTADAAEYVRRAASAKVLVIDIRGYPREFIVYALGRQLMREPTPFARFTIPDLANPGAFRWAGSATLRPAGPERSSSSPFHPPRLGPFYAAAPRTGPKIVVLVDETTQSQAEFTAMALRAVPGVIVVGSTTAGADGNVSIVPIPGGLKGMISGIGVFYPNGAPTQRVGIVPDVVVHPTFDGIRSGRDEVLEQGVSHALGRPFALQRGTSDHDNSDS